MSENRKVALNGPSVWEHAVEGNSTGVGGFAMRSVLGGAVVAALMGFAVIVAPPGRADVSAAFGEENHQVICNLIAQEPTPHGIWAANSYLLTAQDVSLNMNYRQMQNAIGYAVSNHCPQFAQTYSAYRAKYS